MNRIAHALGGVTLMAGGVAFMATPAAAHLSPDKDEVPNEAYTSVTLTVGHGCEGEPTNELTVHIPEGLTNVSPQAMPDWDIEMVEEELDEPIEGPHGDITEVVTEVIFTAQDGAELPDSHRLPFTIGFRTTATETGEYLFFRSIQSCSEGEHAWIEEYVRGVTEGEEPDEPAPAVLVGEPEGEHGEDTGEAEGDDTADSDGAGESAAADSGAAADDSSDDTDGLAVAGLGAGVLGLLVGGFALFRTRSS